MHRNKQTVTLRSERQGSGTSNDVVANLKIAITDMAASDLDMISGWLSQYLGVEITNHSGEESDHRSTLILLKLNLAITFLQAANIPIFATPTIERITTSPSDPGWEADIQFPWLDGISLNALAISLQGAQRLLQKLSVSSEVTPNRDEVYQWISKEVIGRILPYALERKSTLNILRCAFESGIPFCHLGGGIFLVGTGSKGRMISGSMSEGDSMISTAAAQDKALTNDILRRSGLPVPRQKIADHLEAADKLSRDLNWPLVAKPINRDRGEGVIINIRNPSELAEAACKLLTVHKVKRFILEEMQPGTCHRLVIVNRQLVYALIRLPVAVIGDGRSQIRELIKQAHQAELAQPPWLRSGNQYLCDSLTEAMLRSAGQTFSTVPKPGEIVNLRAIESTQWGGRDEDITDSVHPDNIALAIAAADALRLTVAGVDIMSSDLTVPWHENKATINEVNSAPLIGGGETSRKYLPRFLECLLGSNPTIPVKRFDRHHFSLEAARTLQSRKLRQGLRVYIASPDGCFDSSGIQMKAEFSTTEESYRALLRNRNADYLIILE